MPSPTSSFNSLKDSDWSVITAKDEANTSEAANVPYPIPSVRSPRNNENGKPETPRETLAHSIWSDEKKDQTNELEKASKTSNAKSKEMEAEPKGVDTNLIQNRYEVDVKLLDLQADPNSPLYSVKSFEELGLHPNLLKGIYAMKFQKPSKVQERALPLLLSNPPRNMIGQSQSGTGKTAAFVLTMLSRINYEQEMVQVICLSPTRELARQIVDVAKEMGRYTPVKVCLAIKEAVRRDTQVKEHIVVGTPGTVLDILRKRVVDARQVNIFVLDEADNMLDLQGLGDQSMRVKNFIPKSAQMLLFSATFPTKVRDFAKSFAPNANEISLRTEELSVEGIKQLYLQCRDENHKYEVLVGLYGVMNIGQSIIFVARRDTADAIASRMMADGHLVTVLHSARDAAERDAVMDGFRQGQTKVLITTNVLARGIDVNQVNFVVNYDLPVDGRGCPDFETYLHRVGRTGRFGRTGVSIAFIHDKQGWLELDAFQQHFSITMVKIPTVDWEETEKMIKSVLKSR